MSSRLEEHWLQEALSKYCCTAEAEILEFPFSRVVDRRRAMETKDQRRKLSYGKLLISLGVSLALLWFVFRSVDLAQLLERIVSLELVFVLGALVGMVVVQALRAWRFAYLVRPIAPDAHQALIRIGHMGMFLIMFMPLRLGELARPYLMKRDLAIPLTSGLGAAALERALDGLCVALFFFVGVWSLDGTIDVPPLLYQAGWMTLGLFGSVLAVVIFSLVAQGQVEQILRFCFRPLPRGVQEKLFSLYRGVIDGFRTLPDLQSALTVVGSTIVIWLMNALAFYSAIKAFGWSLGFASGLLLVCILVIAIMIPAGPGFLGTYQAAMTLGLGLWGISETDAAAYGLVVYPLSLLVVVAFGAFGFWSRPAAPPKLV